MKLTAIASITLSSLASLISASKQPWVWCYKLDSSGIFEDKNSCFQKFDLNNYMHHHLLSHINSQYMTNFNNGNTAGDEFDKYDCLESFSKQYGSEAISKNNIQKWRWDPCHIDAVQYKRYAKAGITKFRVSMYVQNIHQPHTDKCNEHIRCDALMAVNDKRKDQPKFLSFSCEEHPRIMSYEAALKWRQDADRA